MNKDLEKLKMLLYAVQSLEDEETDFMAELEDAGYCVLQDNPDVKFDEWADTLMLQYPTEITDAIGTNPVKVSSSLKLLWERIRGSQGVDFVSDDKNINETFKIE